MSAPVLILASRSARRASLLDKAGYEFTQTEPPYQDPPHPNDDQGSQSPQAVAAELARLKALSLPSEKNVLFLAADTLIVHENGELAGTPETADQARQMIRRMLECTHQVVTGVALRMEDQLIDNFADTADVTISSVDDRTLDAYLATGDWRGKAGGYNLFERQAAGWPIKVTGDETTVVGLPMQQLLPRLNDLGIKPTVQAP